VTIVPAPRLEKVKRWNHQSDVVFDFASGFTLTSGDGLYGAVPQLRGQLSSAVKVNFMLAGDLTYNNGTSARSSLSAAQAVCSVSRRVVLCQPIVEGDPDEPTLDKVGYIWNSDRCFILLN